MNDAVAKPLQDTLLLARRRLARLQGFEIALNVSTTCADALSLLFPGAAAIVGRSLTGTGTEGWRLTCLLTAAFVLVAMALRSTERFLKLFEKLFRARALVGKLSALEVELATGRDPAEIGRQLATIRREESL